MQVIFQECYASRNKEMRSALVAGGWKFTPIEIRTNHSGSLNERFIKEFPNERAAILEVEELLKEDMVMSEGAEGESVYQFYFIDERQKGFALGKYEYGWDLLKYLYKHVPRNGRIAVHELNQLMDCNPVAPH